MRINRKPTAGRTLQPTLLRCSIIDWAVAQDGSMFLLEYDLVADYLERRSEFREDHLALATRAAQRGDLVLGGALADPADRAILVWRVADQGIVEEFVRADPYVINGLVRSWSIRSWTVVIGTAA